MHFPRISIITPSYNQAEFIEETILSVINQSYPNLEYIIIDGGSTDGSVDIIKKYEKHLAYWESEPDRGHAHALNKGFAKSTGEIMAWINSDDKYLPGAFSTIAEVYTEFKDINWTMGLYANFDRNGVLMSGANNVRVVYKNIYSYIFRDLHIQQESVFWRRCLWEQSGGYIDEKVNLMIDTELWCRFFLYADLWHIDQVIGGYRIYGLNRSHVQVEKVQEDIDNSIRNLVEKLPPSKKLILKKIKQFQNEFSEYQSSIESITTRIRQNFFVKLLPFFIYNKACNYLYKKKMKGVQIHEPVMPVDKSLVFKKIERTHTGWSKGEVPYQFPY